MPIAVMATAVKGGKAILFEKKKWPNEPAVVNDIGEVEVVGDVESFVAAKSIGMVDEDLQQTHVEGLEGVSVGKCYATRVVVRLMDVLHFQILLSRKLYQTACGLFIIS